MRIERCCRTFPTIDFIYFYIMRFLILLLLWPMLGEAQTQVLKGLPTDLDKEKIVFLQHEPLKITVNPKNSRADKYIYHRQKTHNKVIDESNQELLVAAMSYPFKYALASYTSYEKLNEAGYKYVLYSNVYKNDYLKKHPEEDELIVFEYYVMDMDNDIAYKVFEMDEMKVYDSKMLMRKLNRALKSLYNH